MNYSQQADKLAGPIGLLKQYSVFTSLKYHLFKTSEILIPGLYLELDGKQQKVKPLHELPSSYSLLTV
jgi:hypothetical protein